MTRYLRQWYPELVPKALAVAALAVTLMLVSGLWEGWHISALAEGVAQRLTPVVVQETNDTKEGGGDTPKPDEAKPSNETDSDKTPDPGARAVERIQKRHLFAPAPPQAFRKIVGVLGDRVLYPDGASYKVGESFGGATVKAIGSDWVDLEYEGETITIGVFGGQGSKPPKEATEAASSTPDQTDTSTKTKTTGDGSAAGPKAQSAAAAISTSIQTTKPQTPATAPADPDD